MNINKRYIVDEKGNPTEVIIPLDDYRKMKELLGWDLDDETIKQLRKAKNDRSKGNKEAYVDPASICVDVAFLPKRPVEVCLQALSNPA